MGEPNRHRPMPLTDQRTLHDTITILRHHIPLTATGYRCQTPDLWRILVAAAARHTTIESVCADLLTAPHANTVRGYLTAQLSPQAIPLLEQQCNTALATAIPEWVYHRAQAVAVDFHDEPYYGRSDATDPENWVCRGDAQAGTTYFYRCATAYVMQRDVRLTLAVVFVKPGDDKVTLLTRLLTRVRAVGVRLRCLFADKGFCAIPVLRWLQAQRIPAIIAAPIRGKQGGTRALCQGRASYRTTHTFQSAEHGELTVPVAVVRTYHRRRSGCRVGAWLLYVCLDVTDPPPRIRQRYRRRFGIESSYRLMEQVRARTTSPNAALRFVLIGVALLLINIWIRLHWQFLRVPGQGPRRVARGAFRLERMMRFLTRAIERYYGVVTAVDPPAT
jgi:Transposase DDE domain